MFDVVERTRGSRVHPADRGRRHPQRSRTCARMLRAGADKTGDQFSAAVADPTLVGAARSALAASVSSWRSTRKRRADGDGWEVYTHGGRRPTGIDAVEWAARVDRAGRGRDPADEHGRRRHAGRLRPGAHARRSRRRCRFPSSPGRAPASAAPAERRSPTGGRTRCWRPRSSTTAPTAIADVKQSSRSGGAHSPDSRAAGSQRPAAQCDLRRGRWRRGRSDSRPGCPRYGTERRAGLRDGDIAKWRRGRPRQREHMLKSTRTG